MLKKINSDKVTSNILYQFPKYSSQLINLANQNAQGTRPKIVGQLSEEFPLSNSNSIEEWKQWYITNHPDAIKEATNKIYSQIQNLSDVIFKIDKEMIKLWVEDLIINKTFNGLYVQEAILSAIAEQKKTTYKRSTPSDESKGIDGYIDGIAYSIKPDTYKSKNMLNEKIDVVMVYYSIINDKLIIDVEE